jgi:hypothetical protein
MIINEGIIALASCWFFAGVVFLIRKVFIKLYAKKKAKYDGKDEQNNYKKYGLETLNVYNRILLFSVWFLIALGLFSLFRFM